MRFLKVVVFIGLFFIGSTVQAQESTQSVRLEELSFLIEKLRNEIALLQQAQQSTQNKKGNIIPWDAPAGLSLIDNRGVKKEVYVGKRKYQARAYDTLLVRWDNKFTFTDDTTCTIRADYTKVSRSTTLKNSPDAYDHIGIYIPVTERYTNTNLKRVDINCREGNNRLYRTNFRVTVQPQSSRLLENQKVSVSVTARQDSYQSGVDTVWFDYVVENAPENSSIQMVIKNMNDGSDYQLLSRIPLRSSQNQIVDLSRQLSSIPLHGTIVFNPDFSPRLLPITGPLEVTVFDRKGKQIGFERATIELY